MGYTIEISFDLLKHPKVNDTKESILSLALDHGCQHTYTLFEMDAVEKRHHCMIVVNFADDETFRCAAFVKTIKLVKHVYIECIYDDDIMCKLIYASSDYIKHMDKNAVGKYVRFKRERSYSEDEEMILKNVIKTGV